MATNVPLLAKYAKRLLDIKTEPKSVEETTPPGTFITRVIGETTDDR